MVADVADDVAADGFAWEGWREIVKKGDGGGDGFDRVHIAMAPFDRPY